MVSSARSATPSSQVLPEHPDRAYLADGESSSRTSQQSTVVEAGLLDNQLLGQEPRTHTWDTELRHAVEIVVVVE